MAAVSLDSPASASAFVSSDFASSTPSTVASMRMELWFTYAGFLISLPKKRSADVTSDELYA